MLVTGVELFDQLIYSVLKKLIDFIFGDQRIHLFIQYFLIKG